MERKDLKNKANVLILELKELELGKKIIGEIIEDIYFHYIYN